jgi:hypothetical protein
VCVIGLFFKSFKYAQLNTSTSMLWAVLMRAGKDMGYFIIMLVVLMLAFSMMAMQFFGSQLEAYSTLQKAVVSLLLVLLGQFDIDGMRQASPTLGVWFFFAYIIVMVLIMMNIFLAILGEAYSVVRANQDEEKEKDVKTKKRSFAQYLKLVRAVFKARMAQRRARRGGGKANSEGSKPARRKGGFSFSSFKRGKKKADGTKEVTFATSSTTDSAVNATNQV